MMVPPLVTAQIVKWALATLSGMKAADVRAAVKQVQKATRSYPLLPGFGSFGVGLAVGAGVGMLFAPRAGSETRDAIRDYIRERLAKIGNGSPKSESTSSGAPVGGEASASGNGASAGATSS